MNNMNSRVSTAPRVPLIRRVARVLLPLITTTVTLQPLAYAAPSPSLLSQQPRFVDQAVESNVVFLMDDSRSMEDIRLPVPPGLTPGSGGTVSVRGAATGFASGAWTVAGPLANVDRDNEWVYRSSTLNPLYYNPAITYKPWNDNGRQGTSGSFQSVAFGPTNAEVTDSTTQFRFGLTPQDMRYAGPNYFFGNGNNFSRLSTVLGTNPPPVPNYMCNNLATDPAAPGFCRERPLAGGFQGQNDGSRNADLFTSPMVQANGGPQQCTVATTSPTLTALPTAVRDSQPQPSTSRSTSARPSSAVPTSSRTTQARDGTARPQYTRATQTRPSTTPTTAAANVTTRAVTNRTVTTRATQTRPSSAPPATTNRTITTRPSTAVPATTDRTTQARTSTALQSPINRTVTSRVTQYRYETGVCGSGTWSAWQNTAPGTQYCSNPTSEGVSVAQVQTQLSPCPTGSSQDPNNANQCLSNCPSGTTASGTQCVYSCPSGTTQIGSQCYNSCPTGFAPNPSDATQCISNCPSGTTATATQCVGTCPSGSTLIGSQCYSACPTGTSINTDATQCISNCPSGTTATATQCVGGSCPTGTTLISGQCYSACPTGYAISGTDATQCIQNCPTGSAVDPGNAGQCLSNCPTGTSVLSPTQCIANCPSGSTVDPNNSSQCLSCTSGTLNATTAQCTNVCPTGSNLIGGLCYTACPTGYTINGSATTSTQCIQSCATGETTSGSVCLQACPSGYPNIRTTTSTTCYAACPTGFAVLGTTTDANYAQCLSNCPSGFTATSTTTCTGTCAGGTNLISGQCYDACPSGSSINGSASTSTQCISDCPSGTTASGSQCLGTCPSGYPTLSGSTCYSDCPATHPTVNPGNVAQCLGSCPTGTTQSGSQCQACPSGSTLLSSGQCCPTLSTTQGNCPLNRPAGFACDAGKWVPNLDQAAPARYYVFAPASSSTTPTPANLSDPANYIRVEINRDRRHDYPKAGSRSDCAGSVCTWEEEAQNFANWFSYYRTRLQSAVAVTAESLSGLTAANNNLDTLRLGYGSINYFPSGADPYSSTGGRLPSTMSVDGASSFGALVRGVRPFTEVNPPPAPGSNDRRQEAFDWLFSLRATGSTPNRESLDAVGRYFQRTDNRGPWIQPADPSSWSSNEDPADHISCRRNYTILITDGEWTNQPATNPPQQPLVEDRGTPLDALSTSGPSLTGVAGNYTYQPTSQPQFSTNAGSGGTLSDITMYYWSRDLRPDLPNNVKPEEAKPSSQGNPAFWQHVVPYIVGYGINAPLDTSSTRSAVIASATAPQSIAWPTVNLNQLVITDRDTAPVDCQYNASTNPSGCGRVDDTMRAALAARGDFLAATDVPALAQGVRNAFEKIAETSGTGSALAGRSGTLRANDRLFIGGFRTVVWTGRIQSFDALAYFNGLSTGVTPPSFDSRFPAPTSRNVLTSTANGSGAVFPANATQMSLLSSAQRTALNNSVNLALWLRGDQLQEARNGGAFRNRPDGEVMGSIVNSQPFYSKAPDAGYQATRKPAADGSSGNAYRDFVNLNKQYRPARVYVGANDGMLHAFDAEGTPATNANYMNEVFAYVPRAVYPQLQSLASPGYVHRYLVDGPVVEGDVYVNGAWRTVIVGTTGAGPKGVFGLDVTQRSGSTAQPVTSSNVLFDIAGTDTATNIEHLGNIVQPGVIGSGKDGEWYYFVGNGYESQNDKAKLLAIRIRDGNVFVVDTDSAGGPTPASTDVNQRPNGLGGITPVYDTNRNVVAIYGGDRLGRMWKFDLSSTNRSAWGSTLLFTAEPSVGVRQPITAAPRIFPHPLGGRMIVFGTGKIFEKDDLLDTSVQAVYGVWEKNITSPTTVARSDLLQLTLVDQIDSTTGSRFRQLTGVPTTGFPWSGASAKLGWYINLRTSTNLGERVLQSPTENFGFASITTFEPSEDGDPCVGGGRSFFYRLDIAGSFTRAPFANTGPITNLVNSGLAANSLVGSQLPAPTINRLESLVLPSAGTTDVSTSLTAAQTANLAGATASVATNPCAGQVDTGFSNQNTALRSPPLNCPVTPLRVWRDLPRGPR